MKFIGKTGHRMFIDFISQKHGPIQLMKLPKCARRPRSLFLPRL